MTWKAQKAKITTVLSSAGYKELPDNLQTVETYMTDKTYTLKPLSSVEDIMGGGIIALNAELKIAYIVKDNDAYDDQFDNFITVIQSIVNLNFNMLSQPIFELSEDDNTFATGTITFSVGQISAC